MTKYFYILTISWTIGAALNVRTRSGVAEVHEGEDQETVFKALLSDTCTKFGAREATVSVTHYYLARNEL